MRHVASQIPLCQSVITDRNGKTVSTVEVESGAKHFIWMVTYLNGLPLGQVRRRSADYLIDLGGALRALIAHLQLSIILQFIAIFIGILRMQ